MIQQEIDRLNALARKAKAEGLTPAETEEREALRLAYRQSVRDSLTAQLENTYIQYPDGSRKKLEKKQP